MTFFEALKANETKRVRQVGDEMSFEPRRLIEFLLSNTLGIAKCNAKPWEILKDPSEIYVLLRNDVPIAMNQTISGIYNHVLCSSGDEIALYREVPGTREEVKP